MRKADEPQQMKRVTFLQFCKDSDCKPSYRFVINSAFRHAWNRQILLQNVYFQTLRLHKAAKSAC